MKKRDLSRKIIKILANKPAVSLDEINNKIQSQESSNSALKYALNRSIKGLKDSGFIEPVYSSQNTYARLTKEGKCKANSIKIEGDDALVSNKWDGFWRIIIVDIPENRKNEREAVRYLLKKAGFMCVKNSVWISMYPYEFLFSNIKKDLELNSELMIIVTSKLDEETEKEFFKICFKND